jgi:hypothetical protein
MVQVIQSFSIVTDLNYRSVFDRNGVNSEFILYCNHCIYLIESRFSNNRVIELKIEKRFQRSSSKT